MRERKTGGGWPAVWYTFRKAREVGGIVKLWKAMRSKNACKTCALGMGGQSGGMVNEAGHFPEVCKKSLQAMASDMQGAVRRDFFETYSLPQLQAFSPRELETCGRLTTPLIYDGQSQYYRPIEWDDALARIAERLGQVRPDETFWYVSGRSSNEAGFLLQLFARIYGTNNVSNCSYYCHQASGVGLSNSIGVSTATVNLEDVEGADLVFLIGANPASNHPRLMRTLMQTRRNGGEVIVINPVVETGLVNFSVPSDVRSLMFGSAIASLYVQPHIGGDLALLTGIAKRLDEMKATDEAFLAVHCLGWEELRSHLRTLSWEEIQSRSGVDQATIDEVAQRYARAKNVVFAWTMGITHHVHGVANVESIANLALVRGMVGRPNAGLMPIRGHSNVQGIGSVGVMPKLKDAILQRLEGHFGVPLPKTPGLDTIASIEAAAAGQLKFGFCLGGNLFGSNPDATFAGQAMQQLDMAVYLNTTLNTGHAHGLAKETLILPVLARDEEPQPTTQESMFSLVRLSDGGPARHQGPRSEIAILSDLARRVLGSSGPIRWDQMATSGEIRESISRIIPGWEQLGQIDRTRQEFHIPGRRLSEARFPTPTTKAALHIHELPALGGGPGQLRLMTVRSEGQFNTVVYEDYDLYRNQTRRDIVLMHSDDLARLGLVADERVRVSSEAGALTNVIARSYDKIKAGNVLMYYPEANVLVPRAVDPASRTPAFKNVAVTVEPMGSPVNGAPPTIEIVTLGAAETGPSSRAGMRAC